MPEIKRGAASNILRFTLKNSSTGVGLTGLTSSSTGLIISTICDNEATATVYTVTAGNVETITTLGTYAAPTSGKCRFKEVDAANHKGLYEFQFADARFSVASSKRLVISVTGATSLLDADYEVELPDNVEADTYARVGAAGAGLTALGDTRIANLDAAVSSRSTYAGGAVASVTAAVTVGTNNDKTGYSLTQSFPANFAALSITAAGLIDITQAAADKVWGTAARTLTSFGALAADVWAVATRSLTDKAGFALSAAGVQAIWDALTSALTTVGSIGKRLADYVDAAITSRSSATDYTTARAGYLDNLNTGVPLSAASVDAILDEIVEGTLTLRQVMRINLAALAGKSSGGGTATLLFKGADGTTTRITATVDADGNRTNVTVSGA